MHRFISQLKTVGIKGNLTPPRDDFKKDMASFRYLVEGEYYEVSDVTEEGEALIVKICNEDAFEEQGYNVSIRYPTEDDVQVTVKYRFGSGVAFYRFVNVSGPESNVCYGIKTASQCSAKDVVEGMVF